jgi:hypothetical protein
MLYLLFGETKIRVIRFFAYSPPLCFASIGFIILTFGRYY